MPNFSTLLKQEITRLARKEVNAGTSVLRRASAQYRRDIAKLKREIESLQRKLANVSKQAANDAEADESEATEPIRFSARSVQAQRKRIGFSAAEYGRLVGVSGQTIYMWEHGKSRPRAGQLAELVAVRGIGKREARARLTANDEAKQGAKKSDKKKRAKKTKKGKAS